MKEDADPPPASFHEEPLAGPKPEQISPAARALLAGLVLDQGLADKQVAKRWRQSVLDGTWDARACADEVLASSSAAPDDPRLVERGSRLLRDFLMAPFQRGVRGAARRGRERARSGCAYVLVQGFVLLLFTLIAAAVLVLLRRKGHSLDGWADWVLGWFPAAG